MDKKGNISNLKGGERISEKEQKILETMSSLLPKMDEAEKMYLLGQAEGMALMKKKQSRKRKKPENKELEPV